MLSQNTEKYDNSIGDPRRQTDAADTARKKKRAKTAKVAALIAYVCAAAVIGLGLWKGGVMTSDRDRPINSSMEAISSVSEDSLSSGDDSVGLYVGSNSATLFSESSSADDRTATGAENAAPTSTTKAVDTETKKTEPTAADNGAVQTTGKNEAVTASPDPTKAPDITKNAIGNDPANTQISQEKTPEVTNREPQTAAETQQSAEGYLEVSGNTAEITGYEIRIMGYNVAKYNNDSSVYIFSHEQKVQNFRRLLTTVNADIILTSEDNQWVDAATVSETGNSSVECLYMPLYPAKVGKNGPTIHSKKAFTSQKPQTAMSYVFGETTYKYVCAKGIFSVGEKTAAVYSLHLPRLSNLDGVDANGNGVNDGAEIRHGLLACLIESVIAAEAPDYWIVGGDFNPATADEREALLDYCADNGFQVSNGGQFGLLVTHPQTGRTLDYIVSSPNTLIRRAGVLSDWYDELYSDHLPHFADIVFLDQ